MVRVVRMLELGLPRLGYEDPELKLVAALERAGHQDHSEKTLVPSAPAVKTKISK